MKGFHDFDPYDVLVTLNDRVNQLEQAHNRLVHAFETGQKEQKILLHKFRNLEKSHLALADAYFKNELERLNTMSK